MSAKIHGRNSVVVNCNHRTRCALLFLILYICLSLALPLAAWAATDIAGEMEEQTGKLDMVEIQQFINRMDHDLQSALPETDFKALVTGLATGQISMQPTEVFNQCINYLFREVVANSALLGKLVVLAVICAVLQNITGAFEKGTTGQLTHMVAYLVLVTIAVGSFGLAIQLGREVVDKMVIFMQALLPLLLTLLVAVGGIASAAIFHPLIFITITAFGTIIKNVILPLIFFAAVLEIVSGLSKHFQVSRLAGLLKGVAMGLMGLLSTIFLGIMAIQGVAGAVGDSVTFRTAKFATDFIPVVGGVFSDALEAVIRSSLLMKNAVGIAGVLIIIMILVIPLVKIIAIALIYKIAGAVIQPVGEERISDCLNGLGNSLITVFAAVATVGLLFFFALAIVVGLGNITVMLH
ncbi:stage III sporulation protein AE [Desulfoscipio gibsoniae]|uniref:Stage III sporulation protein AE n=1 Tax=Desulfoscipio gibsoniae DSM 7213 TaxID=767817 RepID=R4KNB9_9FIRM|nr:stage III sporulation protein AE [Desulfoscipio gibsoniae]AGL02025.1 stage III sporulation protein AE [Desulfoscipio gibsoniae DSM 7213]